jgi:hypothetical protein
MIVKLLSSTASLIMEDNTLNQGHLILGVFTVMPFRKKRWGKRNPIHSRILQQKFYLGT